LEKTLSRIINPDSSSKIRVRLTKTVVLAIRRLANQAGPGNESRDMAAYIALALDAIAKTIDSTVGPWEKRGYWVKADKFRMDWIWSGTCAAKMRIAVLEENWDAVAEVAAKTAIKLSKITVSNGNRLGEPWKGAWRILSKDK
jgi:hypothetical protein